MTLKEDPKRYKATIEVEFYYWHNGDEEWPTPEGKAYSVGRFARKNWDGFYADRVIKVEEIPEKEPRRMFG